MSKKVSNTDEFRGAHFTRVDLSGATLRDVEAELDRRHPERLARRASTPSRTIASG
jgi:uncharacterized protein YjbI with pentapeptide repeats